MNKLFITLSLLFVCTGIAFADTNTTANQSMTVEENKAVIMVQKQPTDEMSAQKQNVKNNWFCIVIQVNGKIKEEIK